MNESPQIIWEKWRDPYGQDDMLELNEFIDAQDTSLGFTTEEDNIPEELLNEEESEEPKDDIKSLQSQFVRPKIPFMFTPMGIIPYTESTASSKIFNFWTGHTNFNLSQKICDIIEQTEGVESLDIFTRYRFRISVGKVFIDSEVMRKINHDIYQFFLM
jgi:hypothetical protein